MLCPVKSSKAMKNKFIEQFPPKAEKLGIDAINFQINYLQGKVLTIVEAVMSQELQCKATKDLVRSEFSDTMSYIHQLAFPSLPIYTEGEIQALGIDMAKVAKEAEPIG